MKMFRYMNYIYEIYQKKSFSKAAKSLYISQPALSNIVKRVEDQIGVSLFDRSTSPITLTEAGKIYIESAKKVMATEEYCIRAFEKLSDRKPIITTVGASAFFCENVLSNLSKSFSEAYPGQAMALYDANADELVKCLKTGVIDFCITVDNLDESKFSKIEWSNENLVLAVPADLKINKVLKNYRITNRDMQNGNYLKKDFEPVSLNYFKDETFILLKEGNDMHQRAIALCEESGFEPKILVNMDQVRSSYYLAKLGKGITFIRDTFPLYEEPTVDLYYYKIDSPHATRKIYIYSRIDDPVTSASKNLLEFLSYNKV